MGKKRGEKRPHPAQSCFGADLPAEGDAPGWGALLQPLGALWSASGSLPTERALAALTPAAGEEAAASAAALGVGVLRCLQGMAEVHAAFEEAAPCGLPGGLPERGRVRPAELLPSSALGAAVGPLQLPLYERAMASQQAAAYAFLRAVADGGAGGDGWSGEADAAAPEAAAAGVDDECLVALADWSVADSDPQHAAAGGGGGTAAVAAARRDSFRQLYMRLLTEGAADELDALRTAGDGALDGASLSLLARRRPALPLPHTRSLTGGAP